MSNPERPPCINPKCREPLFTPAAKMCHKCFTIQQELPEQQQTAPSGPGPPTSQLPSGSEDRQSRTHTDPIQHIHPPPSGPGVQSSGSQQGNRDGSGNTSKERFFDAQSLHSQTAGPYHREGPPPSSHPNIPQTYQYPQVFGMPQHPRGPGSQGTPVPPFTPGSQPPYYPPPPGIQVSQGGQWLWLPALQQYVFVPHASPHASSQMVHGLISPQSMPSPQPNTSQPQPPRGMSYPQPPTSQSQPQYPRDVSYPQPPTSQSQPQYPRDVSYPQPPTSQSQPQYPRDVSYPQPPTSQSQPQYPRDVSYPQPPTGQSQPQYPRDVSYPQPPTSQSQPQYPRDVSYPQPPTSQSQPQYPRDVSYPQPPTGQSQPQYPRDVSYPQPPTGQSQPQYPRGMPSSAGMPYHQPPTSQLQSPSSTGIVSPQSHPSQPQPSGMSSPQLHTSHPPLEAHPAQPSPSQSSQQPQSPGGGAPLHQQPTGAAPPSESAQSSQEPGTTLPQGHETDSQTQVSTTTPKPSEPKSPVSPKPESFLPLSGHPSAASPIPATSTEKFQAADPQTQKEQDKHLPDHNGTGKGTSGGQVPDKGSNSGQSSTQPQPTNTPPQTTTSFSNTSSHPLQGNPKEGGEQGSENNSKGRKRSTDGDDSGNLPAKLAKQEEGTKKEHNKEPSNDKDTPSGTSKQLSEEPPKDKQPIKPENPVSQHTGDSQAGSATSGDVTKQNQADKKATTRRPWREGYTGLQQKRPRQQDYDLRVKKRKVEPKYGSRQSSGSDSSMVMSREELLPDEYPAEADESNSDSEHGAEQLVPYKKPDEPGDLFSGKDKNKKEKKNKKENKEQEKTSTHGFGDMSIPQGLQAPPEKSIAVTFHAIVPLPFWEWEDSNSHMHIRFGKYALGLWRCNCGEMTKQRAIDDGWYEMTCTLSIDAEILKHPVPYKYVVYSPKKENEDDCYEYLHGYGWDPNRCLRIPQNKLSKAYGGAYHQYDMVVYPKKTKISKSFLERVKETGIVGAIGSLFGRGSTQQGDAPKETDFKPLLPQQTGELCLKAYLAEYKEKLCTGDFPSIQSTAEDINQIYESLYHPVIVHQNSYTPITKDLDGGKFKEVLKEWLESIVDSLQAGSADSPQKQLASAVLIVYCIRKTSISTAHLKIEKFTIPLLRMLCLRPDLEKQRCPDYEYLREMLPKQCWGETAQSIAMLCSRLKQKLQSVEWLLALPLYHFLKGSCKPFGKPEMNPEKIGWGQEEDLDIWDIRVKVHSSKEGLIQEYFEKCEHLFALDPLLLRVVICICPNKDLNYLFERIPPFLSTTWLANRTWCIRAMNKDEAQEWILWLEHIRKLSMGKIQEEEPGMHEKHLISTTNAALLVYRRLTIMLKSCTPHYVEVLKASISLILFAVAQLKICPSDEKDEIIKEAFARLKGTLWEWIVDRKVIGGSVFGGSLPSRYFSGGWKAKEELELWQSLLTLECPPDQQVTEEWHNITRAHIHKRITQVPDKWKFDLVPLLEDHENLHTILSDALMEIGTIAIDNILSKPAKFAEQDFEKLAATESARVGSLLGNLLKKRYPSIHPDIENVTISFDDLLHWHLWPQFIKLYGSESKLKEGLPRECQIACLFALSGFQDVCDHMQKRNISVTELQKIKDNHVQMKRLCEAATAHGDSKESGQLSYKAVNSALSQTMEEFEVFEEYRSHLFHLCSNISPDVVQGLSQLRRELNKDFRQENINKLCVREGTKIRILCFQSADSLSDFAGKFCIMTQKYPSDLFTVGWKAAMNAAVKNSTNTPLTLANICSEVWDPAFRNCQSLLDKLYDRSMKLVHIDRSFRQHEKDLEMQLMNLFAGVNACLGERKNGAWIKGVVRCIHDYWHLCNYRKAASAFLDLKRALNLHGDFRNVEKLATEVTTSMKDQTLASVDDNLIKTGKFLEGISSNPRKLKCLDCFAQCQEVIKWLRVVTKDVSDLQNFVNVALATAAGGEDDLAHDKLSNLRTVGSGFGALIYKLPKDAGYADLAKRCESLWEALQNYQDLPNKLEHCNKQLEWYKSVKETQGSVEVTSFGKMKNILTYGRYRVGAKSTQTVHSIHDMVHLKLENTGKQLPQNNFSLDDLRDLESKLVLITGSKAENRKEVDQFLNTLHSVCRIAEVLLALQQKGNVKYTGWVLNFRCAVDMVDELQQLAKNMEEELQTWEDEVRQARKEYYELNYFTTLQLLTLRQELGRLKTSEQPRAHTQINPQVLALLESISTEMTSPCVWEVVKSITAVQQRGGASVFTVRHHTSAEMLPASTAGPTFQVVQPAQPSLVDDILASADMQASASASRTRLQQPKLTHNQLTEKQREMFDDFINCNYPEQLILMALEKFGEDRYEADNWIIENASQYGSSDDEGGEVDIQEEEGAESDSEMEDTLPQATSLQSPIASKSTPPRQKEPSTPSLDRSPRIEIHVTQKQPVDEYHPTVQQLLEAGYDVEQSIEAVEHHESLEGAMDYLLNLEGEGEIFHGSTQDEGHLHSEEREMEFVEESQEERAIGVTTLTVLRDERAEERYLMLPELGRVLQELRKALPAAVPSPRYFPDILEVSVPNLLVTAPENVLRTALALYMDGGDVALPLPTHEEVLVCNQATTTEEVTLLWQRAIGDPGFNRIFCLLHAEKLSYQVSDQALRSLTELSQGQKQDYRLVIICSNEDEDKSHIISRLNTHRKHFTALHDDRKFHEYLKTHFTGATAATHQSLVVTRGVSASMVDRENSCVRVVSSTRSGMGKSLFITRMANKLTEYTSMDARHVTIPIHGPEVTPDTVMEFLKDHMKGATSTIFHFDIAPTILWKVDTILFCLLVLRGLSDSQGRVWRCHPTQLYTIEVTLPEQPEQQPGQHAIPESCTLALLDLLPSVECLSPRQAMQLMKTGREDPFKVVMDKQEFESPHYQRVYQYLRRHIGSINLDRFSYIGNVEGTTSNCLEIILHSCGLRDPSWAEIRHFVMFLDIQLQSCEASVFCDETFVGDVMAGLKGFVVKFMIRMSRDFATSSLHGEVLREEAIEPVEAALDGGGDLEQYQIVERRQWEHSSHPYIFFNQDGMSITFVGFMVTRNGDLVDPTHGGVLEGAIMTQQLYTGLIANKVNFEEDYQKWQKGTMIEKIATVMGIEYPYDPDESYVLTVDNLIKMLAIQMRFRCGIPVVIMGETGCGKTRLIRYMCDLARQGMDRNNMLIMKVHGGITESDVTKFVEKAEEEAKLNRQCALDTVVFFDEANTTDAIGLIKEIMCDHRLHGRPISRDLKFIAACNPYRKHSEEMIEKLESAGLGFYVRATETQQKLGKIPLRQLVYRVLDLPPSMRPLVYDFGQLTTLTEKDYTKQIVSDHVMKHPVLKQQPATIIPSVARVLAWSQWYMRRREDECSFVSLRDVERAMVVFKYFYDKMDIFGPKLNETARVILEMEDMEEELAPRPPFPDPITRSLLLAISVCYHARLQDREDYEEGVTAQFVAPLGLPGGAAQFRDEIQCCQEVLLDSMTLGPNIARNAALRENVFMMAVCIELRIPLFLVGKPGSSKSLAKSIVQASMQGTTSSSELLRGFKQVHIFSYQCSQLSTPESVIEVFKTAQRFQKNQDTTKYVSVVVLDEVGLAEDSPNLPLKALHPLLEDGTEGADDKQEFIQREKRVAFIGISNWALDPAKMNRGVMVTRGDPDTKELQLSARGICSNEVNDPVKIRLESYFEPLAEAYKKICEKQKKEFFGLRDFYCLVKMLYWMCEKSGLPPTGPQLEHAICRNFGGMESDELNTLEEFQQYIPTRDPPDLQSIPEKLHSIVNPDCSSLGLIKTSLMTKETSWHGENRYLLFLTENYAALEILRHYLNDVVHSSPLDSVATGNEDGGERSLEKMEPFILFGSSFPRDKEYTQVCRNINQIKICMETGRTVILLNLENLYESLYDVLNQYYIYHGGSRYVDLGLQTHRVKCRVHDNFKLIVIAEKKTVYEKFPTPLINRLEKHFVLTSSVLTEEQQDVLHQFQDWIQQFSSVSRTSEGRKFTEGDAFIGYQKDTPAAVVFQATHQLEGEGPAVWERTEPVSVLGPREVEEEEASKVWKENVLKRSQYLLLQTASPDALVRLEQSPLTDQREELLELYFQQQHHNSLEDFLAHYLQRNSTQGENLLMQVTTHSHLLSRDELDHVSSTLSLDQSHIHVFSLQEFDTELDFSNKVSPAFQRRAGNAHDSLLVIQCDSGHLNGDLIACARYRIYDKRAETSLRNEKEGCTHVLFIIHLPRQAVGSSFVGFQGEPWISTHIDDLRLTTGGAITLQEVMGVSISQLFCGKMAADKGGRVGEEKISMVAEKLEVTYSHTETESMQVESNHTTTVQEGLDQDEEMSVEEEERPQSPLPQQPSEQSQMDTSIEGEIPHEAPEIEEPLNLTSDTAKAPVRQILPPTKGIPVGQILPPTKDDSQEVGPHTPPWPVEGSQNTQFRRLHGCIQPAAARLQDSAKNKERATKRVAILVNLIPRDPSFPPDDSTFHGVLVRHIHRLLTERDQVREDEKNWVLNEALSARKLQNGGTFQNVLARKLDDVLVPIFSEIIALVDRNYNLNRLDPKEQNSPLCQFWLAMFRDPAIMQLHYEDMVTTQGGGHREQVPGAGGRMAEEDFKCQLPFSWLVKEAVDTQWHSAKSTVGGSSRGRLHLQLCELMSQTAIGEVLRSVDEANCEEFYQYYLHDFVRTVHRCHHKLEKSENLEYKLIGGALDSLVHGPDFATIDGHESLTSMIAVLHVVYHFAKPQVLWFGQLVSHLPGTMTTLEDKVLHDDSEMVLHLHAVNHALGSLEPPLDKKVSEDKEKAVLASWLNQLRLSQNAIDSILNLPSQSELANRARLKWQLIRALQMFVEHVVLKNEGMIPYLRRLHMHLKHEANFLKASTVDRVKKHLNSMDNEFKKKLKTQPKKVGSIRRNCRAFFMELVSTLCFGAHSAPEPDLIRMLINTVFTEKQETEVGTRDFTPYRETKSDEVPVIRSFLLQLLLEHNTEQVKAHLEEYFHKSQQVLTRGELDQNLCLLCIQCFEDALSKEYALKPSQERAATILEEGHLALQHHTGHSHGEISLSYIEGVAKVRFALSVVAELLHKHEATGPALLHGVREVCTDAAINLVDGTGQTDTIGPVLYLLKLIVRQYGFPCLAEVSTAHTWVVPPELRRADEEQKTVDPFVIYNPLYSDLRECVSGAVYGKQMQQLKESTEDLTLQDAPLLLLALYEKATLSRASALPSRQLLPDVLEELNKFILECKILPKEMQLMARSLIANEQGGTLAQMSVDPRQPLQHRTLGAIVIHTAAVFLCRQKVDILQPFVNMLNNPAVLVNAYLPTMPEDTLPEAKRVLGGRFYECPRGHPYMVGDCGGVVVQHTCNVCGATIGGVNYKLAQDNREARTNDTTQAGYSLGMPEGRSTLPSPERSLSPAACCLVRALMHSALLWASCNNENAMEGLTQLVKVGVRPRGLPEFFWRHLERDVELLGRATGKSIDESAITIHLVLREILLKALPTSAVVTTVTSLGARNAREQWETIFNQNYIQPVLQGLEQKLTEALHSILNDDKQEHDQLFYLVYERVQVVEGSLDPHLWAYRSRITLEHLRQNLQQQNMRKKCPILHAFLQEETNLRATQYLPDIIQLQQRLYDSFHHRLDRKEARRMTIGEFLQSRKHENVRREYQEMVESLQKAWELVGDKLRDHARLKVEEKHLLPTFTLDTSLEYLIPTTVGAGACTTALTDFLVLTHNNFIETCRAIVIKQNQSKSQWREHKVPITHIHGCHLLTYEQQLPSIILSHCRYSLSMGKGQDVSYDLPALEKHLLDRFIHGKPFILSDIPQVVYRKDVYTAVTFAAVRKKVEPQTSLPPRTQQEILQELRTPDRLRETLDVVDIVLGFLSSGGGRADQPLGGYINHTLKMKRRPFSEKAREYCTLSHVLSLWETLSVELARQLTLQGQEPFDLDFMPGDFLEKLTTDGEEDQVEALGRCLRVLDLDNLLGTLYEFIETYVKHSPSNEKDWPLVDTLEVFLERNGLPQLKDFREEFPETITLAQAVDVWKRIVWYQRRLGTHGTTKQ